MLKINIKLHLIEHLPHRSRKQTSTEEYPQRDVITWERGTCEFSIHIVSSVFVSLLYPFLDSVGSV